MNDKNYKKAIELKEQSKQYSTQDQRWRKNFRARCKSLCVRNGGFQQTKDIRVLMILDGIAGKCNFNL